MSEIETLRQRFHETLHNAASTDAEKTQIADDIVGGLDRRQSSYDRDTLLILLREAVKWRWTNGGHVDALVSHSLKADLDDDTDKCLKAMDVLARQGLVSKSLKFIEERTIETAAGRWIIFYAASYLMMANRADLLEDRHIERLRRARDGEDSNSKAYPEYVRLLGRIRDIKSGNSEVALRYSVSKGPERPEDAIKQSGGFSSVP